MVVTALWLSGQEILQQAVNHCSSMLQKLHDLALATPPSLLVIHSLFCDHFQRRVINSYHALPYLQSLKQPCPKMMPRRRNRAFPCLSG